MCTYDTGHDLGNDQLVLVFVGHYVGNSLTSVHIKSSSYLQMFSDFGVDLNGDGPPLPGVATPRGRHSQGAYTNIRCFSAGVYAGDAVRLKYTLVMLFCLSIYSRCCSA